MFDSLGFDLKKAGILSSLPHLARFLAGFVFGWIGDCLRRKHMSQTLMRKSFCIFCKNHLDCSFEFEFGKSTEFYSFFSSHYSWPSFVVNPIHPRHRYNCRTFNTFIGLQWSSNAHKSTKCSRSCTKFCWNNIFDNKCGWYDSRSFWANVEEWINAFEINGKHESFY